MVRKTLVIWILFLVAGCLPSTDSFVVQNKKNDNSFLNSIDENDSVRIDVALVNLPLVEKNIFESIWSMADHNSVGLEKKAILGQNGFRVTNFGKSPPSELLRLLGSEKYTPNPRRFIVKIGGEKVIPFTGVMESLDSTLFDNDASQIVSLKSAQAFLKVSPVAVSDYYQLSVQPSIKSGNEKLLPKAVKTVSGNFEWEMHSFKAEKVLEELAFELKVEPGDFVVVGPSETPKEDLKSLGANFFYTKVSQNLVPRILVLRCSKKNKPLSASIGEFGKSLPLAIQASWKNFEDDQ